MKAINQRLDTVEERLDKLIIKVAKDTVTRVQDYILQNYYEAYAEGDNYERLGMNGGFAGAISYEYDKSNRTVRIFFDPSFLMFGHTGSKSLPSHMENGQKFIQGLYDYMMYGEWPNYKPNNVAPNFTGLNDNDKMSKEISDWLTEYTVGKIKDEMEKQGFSFESLTVVSS